MQETRQKYLFASIASHVRKPVKSNVSPRQTKRQLTNYTRTHQYTGMGFRSKRRYANRHSSRTPTKWRLRKHHHSNWCILKKCICIPSIQFNSRHHSQSYHQHHDKTCVLSYCIDNRESLSFHLKCDTLNSWCPRYHTPPCKHEACKNYRSPKKNACHDKNITENVFGRILQKTAQTFTVSNFMLQHKA